MTPRIVYTVAWLVLALVTLALLVRDEQSLAVAFTAWLGGIVTARLWTAWRTPPTS